MKYTGSKINIPVMKTTLLNWLSTYPSFSLPSKPWVEECFSPFPCAYGCQKCASPELKINLSDPIQHQLTHFFLYWRFKGWLASNNQPWALLLATWADYVGNNQVNSGLWDVHRVEFRCVAVFEKSVLRRATAFSRLWNILQTKPR